jgi:hypothetical protein
MSSMSLGKDVDAVAAQFYEEASSCLETLLFGKQFDFRLVMGSYTEKHRAYSTVLKQLYEFYRSLARTPEVIVAQNELLQRRMFLEDQHLQMIKRLDNVCRQNANELERVLANLSPADGGWDATSEMRIPFDSIFIVIDGRIIPLVHVAVGNVAVASGTFIPSNLTISGIEIGRLTNYDLAVKVEVGIMVIHGFYRDQPTPA